MAEYPARRDPKRPRLHPGKLLRDEALPAIGKPKTEIARLLGISRQTLYGILDERLPITPAMALRIGKLCGNGPSLWLSMQQSYDLWHAEQKMKDELAAIPNLNAA
jgi:antitoxin HigA-1